MVIFLTRAQITACSLLASERHSLHLPNQSAQDSAMKVLSSLSSAKRRHADCQIVKRKGTLYVICKSNPKFKARQGATVGTRLSKKGL